MLWWFVWISVLLALGTWFFSKIQQAQEAARESACIGYRFGIYNALLFYHDEHGHFPPAYVIGPDGKRWHSWRALILPYLDEDLARQYRFDEPWNGPNNRKLANTFCPGAFQCPSGPDRDRTCMTNFAVVVGDDTLFPGTKTTSIPNLIDRRDPTILFVEVADSDIHWLEPRDLTFDDLTSSFGKPHLGGYHPTGIGIARANRSFERLPRDLPREELIRQFSRRKPD